MSSEFERVRPARVFLLSSYSNVAEDIHWASPYAALRRAFLEHPSVDAYTLVDSAEDADLILICPRPRNPVFPSEVFREGVAWRTRHKCVVISTDDNPTMTHKGFYTGLRASKAHSPLIHGGIYPSVSFAKPDHPFALSDDFRFLFSFLGSFDTHPVRRKLGALSEGDWKQERVSFLLKNTAGSQSSDSESFRTDYLASLRHSKFILCPRGMCPSSLRLFETMKAGRVPVVISDDWVPPPEVRWENIIVRVAERDISLLPSILASEEPSFAERAEASRAAWEQYFAANVIGGTVTRWGTDLIRQATENGSSKAHLVALWSQLFGWRFIRRGLISELRWLISRASAP